MATKKSKVVVGQSTVTAGQLEELMRQIKDGTLGGDDITSLLEKRQPKQNKTTIVRALNILGPGKVVTAQQSAMAWGLTWTGEHSPEVEFGDKVLRECARSNHLGTDFRLVYINDLSLNDLKRILVNRKATPRPRFDSGSTDTLVLAARSCYYEKLPARYHLIDFNPRFDELDKESQNKKVEALGCYYQTGLSELVQALFAICITRNGERLLQRQWHQAGKLSVGDFTLDGLRVIQRQLSRDGICVSRYFHE